MIPETISPLWYSVILISSFFTSALSATLGIGGGIALLSIMAFAIPSTTLIPVHGAVQFGSNFGRTIVQCRHIAWPFWLYFSLGGVIGAFLGGKIAITLPPDFLKGLLAIFILVVLWVPIKPQRIAGKWVPG